MVLIRCSYPKCQHSVSAANMLLALDLALRCGYTEDGRDGRHYCSEHPREVTSVDDPATEAGQAAAAQDRDAEASQEETYEADGGGTMHDGSHY